MSYAPNHDNDPQGSPFAPPPDTHKCVECGHIFDEDEVAIECEECDYRVCRVCSREHDEDHREKWLVLHPEDRVGTGHADD